MQLANSYHQLRSYVLPALFICTSDCCIVRSAVRFPDIKHIMHSAALNSSGFAFVIDPDAFVVHRPHTKSTAQRIFDDENDRRCGQLPEPAVCQDHHLSLPAQSGSNDVIEAVLALWKSTLLAGLVEQAVTCLFHISDDAAAAHAVHNCRRRHHAVPVWKL